MTIFKVLQRLFKAWPGGSHGLFATVGLGTLTYPQLARFNAAGRKVKTKVIWNSTVCLTPYSSQSLKEAVRPHAVIAVSLHLGVDDSSRNIDQVMAGGFLMVIFHQL